MEFKAIPGIGEIPMARPPPPFPVADGIYAVKRNCIILNSKSDQNSIHGARCFTARDRFSSFFSLPVSFKRRPNLPKW